MLEALYELGVSYIFCNLGSDHPAIIEALAKAKVSSKPVPKAIITPHESVALNAAHGCYLASGKAQGVFVHTDVGTQNMGGSLHNIARSRVPLFIFSGETPYTMYGELRGSRNSEINYLQNVYDQRGIVRNYVKWEGDVRTGKNVKQLVYRCMQIANSEPKGPVYLAAAREVLEENLLPDESGPESWKPLTLPPVSQEDIEKILRDLAAAENPLLITSSAGRNAESVDELVKLCETLAIPVIEMNPQYMNFPANHPLHLGFDPGERLSEADVVLVVDSDVPWIPNIHNTRPQQKIYYIDADPIKEDIPLWHIPAEAFYKADSLKTLKLMNAAASRIPPDRNAIASRAARLAQEHERQRRQWKEAEKPSSSGYLTPEYVTACIREAIDDDTIVLNEALTSSFIVSKHLPRSKPGTIFFNGGSSLGWSGGGAFGVKLAQPDRTVINLIGDGCYMLSNPSAVYWMARRYKAPIMTIVYNNQGWNATKLNYLRLYPDGVGHQNDLYWVNFDQPADMAKIAEGAGGAFAASAATPDELTEALNAGLKAVRSGQSAVIDVKLEPISAQKD